MRPILKFIVGIDVYKNEKICKEKQFIIVANHNSHIDAMAIMSSLPASKIFTTHPVAAMDYWGKSSLSRFLSHHLLNVVLINRNKQEKENGTDPIEAMLTLLRAGKSLVIFPEGSRGNPGEWQQLKKGVAILLKAMPEISCVPVYLENTGASLPRGDSILVPFCGYISWGDPFKICPEDSENLILEQIKAKIIAQKIR